MVGGHSGNGSGSGHSLGVGSGHSSSGHSGHSCFLERPTARTVSGSIILRKVFGRASGLNRFHRLGLLSCRSSDPKKAAASANRTQAMTSSTIDRTTIFLAMILFLDMEYPPLHVLRGRDSPARLVLYLSGWIVYNSIRVAYVQEQKSVHVGSICVGRGRLSTVSTP